MKRYGFIGLAILLGSGCAHVAHQSEQHDQPLLHVQQRAIHTQPEPQATTHVGDVSRKRGDVESVVRTLKKAIQASFKKALEKNPTLRGQIALDMQIAPNGDVLNVSIRSSDLEDQQLNIEILNIFKAAKFSQGDYDVWHDIYKLNLIPQ